jgi:hypothetical protein
MLLEIAIFALIAVVNVAGGWWAVCRGNEQASLRTWGWISFLLLPFVIAAGAMSPTWGAYVDTTGRPFAMSPLEEHFTAAVGFEVLIFPLWLLISGLLLWVNRRRS